MKSATRCGVACGAGGGPTCTKVRHTLLPRAKAIIHAHPPYATALAALPPRTDYNNHYAYARQTDSALVHFQRPAGQKIWFEQETDHFEKFLFYRGIGNFSLPAVVTAEGAGKVTLTNRIADPIGTVIYLNVDDKQGAFTVVSEKVGANGSVSGQIPSLADAKPMEEYADALAVRVRQALEGAGLCMELRSHSAHTLTRALSAPPKKK